ncbi:MAG: glycosyltransferase [Gemmatimonadetes bacterium]|nr:glycosyltransferase [Gemmatimonadota bacterium]
MSARTGGESADRENADRLASMGGPGPSSDERPPVDSRTHPTRSSSSEAIPGKVVAVVLTWNNYGDTAEALEGLRASTRAADEVLIVDNGSTDDTAARLRERFPAYEVLTLPENRGFTLGSNRGLAEALDRGADFILFLANDTVPAPDALAELLRTAGGDERAGIVGPRVMEYDAPSTLQHGAGYVDPTTGGVRIRDAEQTAECDWITGCAFLLRADALRALPEPRGFDPRYHTYWEDVDFSVRLRRAGFRALYEPRARVLHKESEARRAAMSPLRRLSRHFYTTRNRYLFARRHLSSAQRLTQTAWLLGVDLPMHLWESIKRNRRLVPREVSLIFGAHVDGLRGRTGPARREGIY